MDNGDKLLERLEQLEKIGPMHGPRITRADRKKQAKAQARKACPHHEWVFFSELATGRRKPAPGGGTKQVLIREEGCHLCGKHRHVESDTRRPIRK